MTPYDPYAKQQPHYQTTSPPPQAYTPVPPPVNTPAVAPPPIPEKKKFGGKLGGMMASSFAGGIGFGAGSAIAVSLTTVLDPAWKLLSFSSDDRVTLYMRSFEPMPSSAQGVM